MRAAAHILTACIGIAHDDDTSHEQLCAALQAAVLLIQDTRESRLRQASHMLEVCIIGIRDVESCVKLLVARARMGAALKLIEDALLTGESSLGNHRRRDRQA
jgi:hypothetical protein